MAPDAYPHIGFDPAPGDLESTRTLTETIGHVLHAGGAAKTELKGIGSTDGLWVGRSADAFTSTYAEVPPYLERSLNSLTTAHRALTRWERQLEGFQARARRLDAEARQASGRVRSARTAVNALPASTRGMTDAEEKQHNQEVEARKGSLDAANDALASVRHRALRLKDEHGQAASDTARLVRSAADDAPPKPGWLDEAAHAFLSFLEGAWDVVTDPDFWKMIGDILADVALVVGVAALFVSGLGVAAFVVAALALTFHLAAKAGGADVSWETIAWDGVGVLAGGVSLGGARLAASGEGLMAAGRELRLSSGLMDALSKVRPGNMLPGLKGIPSGLANTARGFATTGKGWLFRGVGSAIDTGATWTGAALGIGSNAHSGSWGRGRWTDGKWEIGDIPVVGPLANYIAPPVPASTSNGSGPVPQSLVVHTPAALYSSGRTFIDHLDPAQLDEAA